VVVLLHGIASSSATFIHLLPLLSATHRVIALDLLGFGLSRDLDPGDYTLDDHAGALDRTIRSLRLHRGFVLVGHSLGALIAVRFAATRRSHVARLVLISPPIYPPPESLAPLDRATETILLRAYSALRSRRQTTIGLARQLERMPQFANVIHLDDDNWTAFERSLAHAIEGQSTVRDLAHLDLPIDIVYGSSDPFVLSAGIRLAGDQPNVTIHRIAHGDHLIRPTTATVVARLIGDPRTHCHWLGRVPKRREQVHANGLARATLKRAARP
jgi:pimeloyl-ACP methyl ester carboxylesterase